MANQERMHIRITVVVVECKVGNAISAISVILATVINSIDHTVPL